MVEHINVLAKYPNYCFTHKFLGDYEKNYWMFTFSGLAEAVHTQTYCSYDIDRCGYFVKYAGAAVYGHVNNTSSRHILSHELQIEHGSHNATLRLIKSIKLSITQYTWEVYDRLVH